MGGNVNCSVTHYSETTIFNLNLCVLFLVSKILIVPAMWMILPSMISNERIHEADLFTVRIV